MIGNLRALFNGVRGSRIQLSDTEEKNVAFLNAASSPLTFVSSYPRSGNTWLRYLMTDCLLQTAGYECSTELPVHPNDVIPDLHCHSAEEIRAVTEVCDRFFYKTHFTPAQVSRLMRSSPTVESSYIYLYRDPADALISYYYYNLRYPQYSNVAEKGPDLFCTEEITSWIDHVEQAVSCLGEERRICFIKYEDLHAATAEVLQGIWNWLNVNVSSGSCIAAATHMEFASLQDLERRTSTNESPHRFFRRGLIGGAKKELNANTTDFLRTKSEDLLRKIDALKLEIKHQHT
jgi:hypothetical protein